VVEDVWERVGVENACVGCEGADLVVGRYVAAAGRLERLPL
jgi:hypothetical protein